MSMNQEINPQILAELLNMDRHPGSFAKRLNHDMKHYKNINLNNDPRIVIIKNMQDPSPLITMQDPSPLMQDDSVSMSLTELIKHQEELIKHQENLIKHQEEQLSVYRRESITTTQYNHLPMIKTMSESMSESIPESIPESMIKSMSESIPESMIKSMSESMPESMPESIPISIPTTTTTYDSESSLPIPHKKKHLKTVRFRLPLYRKNNRHRNRIKTRRATPGPLSPNMLKL